MAEKQTSCHYCGEWEPCTIDESDRPICATCQKITVILEDTFRSVDSEEPKEPKE